MLLILPAFAGPPQGEDSTPPASLDQLAEQYTNAADLVDREETRAALALLDELHLAVSRLPEAQQVFFGHWAAELRGRAALTDGRPEVAARILQTAIREAREQDWSVLDPDWWKPIDSTIVNLMIASAEHRLAVGEQGRAILDLEALVPLDERETPGAALPGRDDPLSITPDQVGTIHLILGGAHQTLAATEEGHLEPAREYLGKAKENEQLHSRTRFEAAARAALLELDVGEFEVAREDLGLAEQLLPEVDHSATEPAFLHALAARLGRLDGEPRHELESLRDELARDLAELCQGWRDLERSPGRTASIRYDRERLAVEELLRLEHHLDGAEAALERLVEVQAAVLYRPLERREECWLEEVREQLVPPGGGILLYFPGPSRVHLFLIDDETVERKELVNEDELRPLIGTFERALAQLPAQRERSDERNLVEKGAELADLLLPEVVLGRLEQWSSLTIVTTGRLWELHFRALPFDGARLGERKATGFLPSLALGLALARREEPRWGECEILLLGAPPSTEGYPELVVTSGEWNRCLRAYESVRRTLLVGREASIKNLAALDLGRIPVVQFVAHGDQDYEQERPWGVVLEGGVLRSDRVDSLRSGPGGLVILSACGSGSGPLRVGAEEVTTIWGAFLWKGARDVVLSNADATRDATLALSGVFHEALSSGSSPAEALRRATEALSAKGDHTDPFHHSMVRVVGLAHRPYFEARPLPVTESAWRWVLGPLLALALILAVLGFNLRRRRRARFR